MALIEGFMTVRRDLQSGWSTTFLQDCVGISPKLLSDLVTFLHAFRMVSLQDEQLQ